MAASDEPVNTTQSIPHITESRQLLLPRAVCGRLRPYRAAHIALFHPGESIGIRGVGGVRARVVGRGESSQSAVVVMPFDVNFLQRA